MNDDEINARFQAIVSDDRHPPHRGARSGAYRLGYRAGRLAAIGCGAVVIAASIGMIIVAVIAVVRVLS